MHKSPAGRPGHAWKMLWKAAISWAASSSWRQSSPLLTMTGRKAHPARLPWGLARFTRSHLSANLRRTRTLEWYTTRARPAEPMLHPSTEVLHAHLSTCTEQAAPRRLVDIGRHSWALVQTQAHYQLCCCDHRRAIAQAQRHMAARNIPGTGSPLPVNSAGSFPQLGILGGISCGRGIWRRRTAGQAVPSSRGGPGGLAGRDRPSRLFCCCLHTALRLRLTCRDWTGMFQAELGSRIRRGHAQRC